MEVTKYYYTRPDPEAEALWQKEYEAKRILRHKRALLETEAGKDAFERLLSLAESRESGQIEKIARFIGALWNGSRHFDFFDLRCWDDSIADDALTVLSCFRWGQCSIESLVENGGPRIESVLERWGMYGVDQKGQFIAL